MAQKKTVRSIRSVASIQAAKPALVPPIVRDANGLIASAVSVLGKAHKIGPTEAAEALRKAAADVAFKANIKEVWDALSGTRVMVAANDAPVKRPGVVKTAPGGKGTRKRA